jgi:hypothetical protein
MSGMFTFQGDYKRRAQVNLGRTTHEDRAALLRKAQEERRAREEKRRREEAAVTIQVPSHSAYCEGISNQRGAGVLERTEKGCRCQREAAAGMG